MCVLLPDPKSSVRWETQDRPTFIAAFKKAKVTTSINNADNDAQKQRSQADQCLANGAKVVILVSLDAGSSLRDREGRGREAGEGDRVRPAGRQGLARVESTSRSTAAPSASCRARASSQGSKGQWEVRAEAGHRVAQRRPDRQQLVPVQGGLRLRARSARSRAASSRRARTRSCPGWDNQKARTIFEQMLVLDLQQDRRASPRPTTASRTRS